MKHTSSNRRNFLQRFGLAAGAAFIPPFFETASGRDLLQQIQKGTADPEHEDFWYLVKQAYTVSANIVNLNNGGVSPQPKVVQEAVEHYNRLSNETPSYYMWRILDQGREPLRQRLADAAGCSTDELAINRNASEALETIIFGLPLQAGDEVVLSKYDYPNMINAWKQREVRDGLVLKWVELESPEEDEAAIVRKYTRQFTDRTKVVHITHLINWNGQILPAKAIARAAKERDIEVLVDAAHSFAQLDYVIPDLECDYLGTSLHKWMCAPFGSGLLYVRKEKIAGLYPLFAAPDPASDDIRKFEHLGTRSFAIEQGIGQALTFHEMIGSQRKEARLRYLKEYWMEQVADLPGIRFYTSREPAFACALANVGFEGKPPGDLANFLFQNYKIHSVAINWEDISGVRITPNVYTVRKDLDRLVQALRTFPGS